MAETVYKLAACILHYGSPELTERIFLQLRDEPDVFVLDNAAPEPFPGAWVRLPDNLYWAGALEWAAAHFDAQGYTHLWFLNNDAYFLSRSPIIKITLQRLARMEKMLGRVGIYTPAVSASPYHPQMVQNRAVQCRQTAVVDGIAPLLNLQCLREIGGVDASDNPWGYGVDLWLSVRAGRAGWLNLVDNQVVVRHNYHSTAARIHGFMERAALAEVAFLKARLGRDYKNKIQELQAECRDINNL
ncbi:MAG: hypothetical protein IJD04_07350 [Desulfovibrionaceae bacterium]|nr:hypothetical protein [Desulfovibrionaceae bacterium]